MKELSIEGKATRYDQALERARAKYAMKDQPIHQDLVDIFPELAESKNEGIYRKLIAFLKQCKGVYGDGFKQFGLDIDDALAWLEKQCEKEEFIKKELECIRGYRDEAIRRLNELEQQGEQKHQYISRPKYIGEEELLGTNKQGKCPFLKQELIDMDFAFTQDGDLAYPIHKIENKEFAAWSEEDEKMLDGIIEASTHHCYLNITDINWLKSLKERYTWKPSKEQIKAVKLARSFVVDDLDEHPSLSEILIELEEQLKKL